ncbi:hypothetical protein NQ314_004332 [Rhamnusium bicolor]|uniref:Endonuclease/exonuclease/phosphatase domain-containing protein n=1 Tax=Rhamnusium bicolor TaxID=1586634 RepID=A0AAV8ZMC9_9CUCU|nr:hypothetical protein NQ314_004332 [Rhamnusium bicolor]
MSGGEYGEGGLPPDINLQTNIIIPQESMYQEQTERRGIVKGVDTYFREEYLLNEIKLENPNAVNVKRFTRKIVQSDGVEKIVPRQLISVSFLGTSLPNMKCLRYGHVMQNCKGKSRCKNCGETHEEFDNCTLIKCIYCNSNEHISSSKECSEYQNQRKYKETMAKFNVSFKEAKQINKFPDYSKILTQNKFDILDEETWLKPEIKISFPGYHIIRNDRPNGKGGVAVLVASHLTYQTLTFDNLNGTNPELCGVKILFNNNWLHLLTIYRPPTVSVNERFGGDFNAHNCLWGSVSTNKDGKELLNALDASNLIVLNNGAPTRLVSPNIAKSCVDISIASPNIAAQVQWDVTTENLGSDHFTILMTLNNHSINNTVIYPVRKWRLDTADWQLFTNTLESSFINVPKNNGIEQKLEYFTDSLNSACQISMKRSKPFTPKKSKKAIWWDNECDLMVEKRKEILRKYKLQSTEINYIECKKIMAQAKRLFKIKAAEQWKHYCNSLNKSTPLNKIWNKVKSLKNIKIKKTFITDAIAEDILNHLTPPLAEQQYEIIDNYDSNHFLTKKFSLEELNTAIKKSTNTSPGLDHMQDAKPLETAQLHQSTKTIRRRRIDRSINNNGPISIPITPTEYVLHNNNNNHVKTERLSPGTPDTSSRSRSVTPSSASHPDTPPAVENPSIPVSGRNYSDFMRSLAAKYNNANPNEYVSSKDLISGFSISGARNGFPPPLDPRFKPTTFPNLLPSLTPQNKDNEVNNKKTDFSVLNSFAGVAGAAIFPPLIDMSTTQTLLAMVRTAKEAELQGLLKNVKRQDTSSPLDLSSAALPTKRPRIKMSSSSSPNCVGSQIPKRSESESPKLHEDISNWTVDDVCNFISSIDICAEYAQVSGQRNACLEHYNGTDVFSRKLLYVMVKRSRNVTTGLLRSCDLHYAVLQVVR